MTGHRRLAVCAAAALLAACTATPPAPEPAPTTTAALPSPSGEPPRPVLRAAVDLGAGTVAAAVGTPDGGAVAVLQGDDGTLALVTVDGAGTTLRSVPAPALAQVFGAHLLPSGEVVLTGQFPRPDRDYGFVAVDPATGAARTVVAARYEEGTAFSFGRSALAAGGTRLFLFVATAVDIRNLDLLYALDPATGEFLGGRDLFEEVRQVSSFPVATHSSGLLPRPDGGVTLAFDVWDDGGSVVPAPGLLAYDADLEPVGPPARLRVPTTNADVQAAAVGPDGALHLVVQPRDGDLLVTADGGVARVEAVLGGHSDDDSLTIDAAGAWAVLPGADGARVVDLAGGAVGTVDVGCPTASPVTGVAPGSGATRALLLGGCAGRPFLWLVG